MLSCHVTAKREHAPTKLPCHFHRKNFHKSSLYLCLLNFPFPQFLCHKYFAVVYHLLSNVSVHLRVVLLMAQRPCQWCKCCLPSCTGCCWLQSQAEQGTTCRDKSLSHNWSRVTHFSASLVQASVVISSDFHTDLLMQNGLPPYAAGRC